MAAPASPGRALPIGEPSRRAQSPAGLASLAPSPLPPRAPQSSAGSPPPPRGSRESADTRARAGSARAPAGRGIAREVELYAPVKAFLEARGYDVKGEIAGCDIVAIRADEPPVIVELKLAFTLGLVLQGVDRLAIADTVYLAVPAAAARRRGIRPLCRRLGLGLLAVHAPRPRIEVLVDPGPYRPRRDRRRSARLVREHGRRLGDPTPGGVTRAPIMTAYRQEALRLAAALRDGPATVAALRIAGDAPNAGRILARDVYGWFERVGRGSYRLRNEGVAALGMPGGDEP